MLAKPTVKFSQQRRIFFKTLHSRVDEYFKTNNINRYGNGYMVLKTIILACIYFIPYFLIVFGFPQSFGMLLLLNIVMGFGMAFIGLSVMHDANHGSYSRNQRTNRIMSYSMNFIGGHALNWQLQHNTLHHTYTNIHGHDEDIAPIGLLRFCPHAPIKKIHRAQFIYAWFLYGLMTLMWVTTKDFKQLKRFRDMGMLKERNINYRREMIKLVALKLFYYVYMIGFPIAFSGMPWYYIITTFLVMQFVAGLTLACIFQPAHVIEDTSFPLPDATGNMENDWAIHQLYTTANYAPKNRILSWFVGGLNYQIEHHLFPTICHVHYRKISKIVKETALEFEFPYFEKKTFIGALWSHNKTLIKLGRPTPALATV